MKVKDKETVWDELHELSTYGPGSEARIIERAIARGLALERVAEAARDLVYSTRQTGRVFPALAHALADLDALEGK